MIRYKLDPREYRVVVWHSLEKGAQKTQVCPHRQDFFLDILETNEETYKIRVHMPDGSLVVGWITRTMDGLIVLHNPHELFDGRFNADQVKG